MNCSRVWAPFELTSACGDSFFFAPLFPPFCAKNHRGNSPGTGIPIQYQGQPKAAVGPGSGPRCDQLCLSQGFTRLGLKRTSSCPSLSV